MKRRGGWASCDGPQAIDADDPLPWPGRDDGPTNGSSAMQLPTAPPRGRPSEDPTCGPPAGRHTGTRSRDGEMTVQQDTSMMTEAKMLIC